MIKDKRQLCREILGIKERGLEKIERSDELKDRLYQKGYNLIRRFKEGRSVKYELELFDENKEIYSNLVEYYYGVDKEYEFTKYYTHRTHEIFPLTKTDIGRKVNVGVNTISRWDDILVEKNIISKDGYFYFYIDKESGEISQCGKEEYNTFWQNISHIKALKSLEMKYISGVIDLNELRVASDGIDDVISAIAKRHYFRGKKYKVNKDNPMHTDTWNLIKSVYLKNI